jgi:hypothetical protein
MTTLCTLLLRIPQVVAGDDFITDSGHATPDFEPPEEIDESTMRLRDAAGDDM